MAGDIGPMINFIHIKDLVEIVYIIINKGRSGYEIFNLGGEYGITLKSIVYKIYEYLNAVSYTHLDVYKRQMQVLDESVKV